MYEQILQILPVPQVLQVPWKFPKQTVNVSEANCESFRSKPWTFPKQTVKVSEANRERFRNKQWKFPKHESFGSKPCQFPKQTVKVSEANFYPAISTITVCLLFAHWLLYKSLSIKYIYIFVIYLFIGPFLPARPETGNIYREYRIRFADLLASLVASFVHLNRKMSVSRFILHV